MNRYRRLVLLLLFLSLLSLPLHLGLAADQPAPHGARAGAAFRLSDVDTRLQPVVRQALYGVEAAPEGFRAANPAQRLFVSFTGREARIASPGDGVGLRLSGYGYGKRLLPAAAARPAGSGTRVEYRRGSLTEWYANRPEGLEQGFTLAARPGQAEAGERLIIALEVTGTLQPVLAPGGDAVVLESGGQARLRYSGLRAWDAAGRQLEAKLDVRGRQVRLAVDDALAAYPVTVDPLIQAVELAVAGAAGDAFGVSAAISGDTVLIGAMYAANSLGMVYVFQNNSGVWSQQATLTDPDGAMMDTFGASVAVNGDTALIGAGKAGQGAAYFFTRNGTIWTLQQALALSSASAHDGFGDSLALSGDTAVIGAGGRNSGQGAAYVFTCNGTTWTQQQELTAADGAALDGFGTSVALSADTAVIGAYYNANGQGAVYLFTRSNNVWSQQQKLTASDGVASDAFGLNVAVSGDTAVIGAAQNPNKPGAAYVFARTNNVWSQQQKLAASGGTALDLFGYSVGVSGDTAVIGSIYRASQARAADVFTRNGTTWTRQQELTAADGLSSDFFGAAVAFDGNTAVITAPGKWSSQGAAYLFAYPPSLSVASSPPGLAFTATGAGCPAGLLTTPYTLPAGLGCTVTFAVPVQNGAGTASYSFQQWQDGNTSNPRTIPAPPPTATNLTYLAEFSSQYYLRVTASPAGGGTVAPSGWYPGATNASVSATANPGWLFAGFGGDASGLVTPQSILMNGPKVVTASFTPTPGVTMSALISAKSGPQNARMWNISLTNSGPGVAYAPQFNGVVLTQTYGTACTPVRLTPAAFPINLANLAVGTTAGSAQFDFTSCPANARFTVVVVFTANGGWAGGATTLANQTM
ncbi:conserved exported hypothetical protein [Candidatus Sulfopaludibacter sp. SbA3]|nr:conserved exported hypothetical protein [Candidatus Sulfopaludibacter sp. SbA3]